jgi:hypothetical protein
MARTRRSLLTAGVAGLAGVATAGCLGGSPVRYPATETADGRSNPAPERPVRDGTATAAGTETATQADAEVGVDPTRENPELAAATRRICAEIRWFGTRYADALDAYRSALRDAARATARVREGMAPSLSADGLRRVEAVATTAREVSARRLGDHFGVDELVADEVSYHLEVIRRFARRDDHDRVAEELTRLENFYRGAITAPFVRRAMPDDPVQNRLLRWLGGGEGIPVVFAVRHPASRFAAYAYPGERRTLLGDPVGPAERRRYDRRFGPLARGDRRDVYYLVPTLLPDVDDNTDDDARLSIPEELGDQPSLPLYVQRFPDAETAANAETALLNGPVAAEGRYSFGRDLWRRVYYRVGDDVLYAYLVRAGEFLVATAPSETAWEERVDWRGPVERSWVWTRGVGTDTPTDG